MKLVKCTRNVLKIVFNIELNYNIKGAAEMSNLFHYVVSSIMPKNKICLKYLFFDVLATY